MDDPRTAGQVVVDDSANLANTTGRKSEDRHCAQNPLHSTASVDTSVISRRKRCGIIDFEEQ